MSWQQFRCGTNCTAFPDDCISEHLYKSTMDALISTGLLAAGYDTVHLDDCIVARARDPATNKLVADPDRFPSGFKALGDYLHAAGGKFGFYTAMSTSTCGGYPASANFIELDAQTFASWGVDYLKVWLLGEPARLASWLTTTPIALRTLTYTTTQVDGCGDAANYPQGYRAMGDALQSTGRDIVYSCSWPAYLGDDESQKPFGTFIEDGCNLWRNFIGMYRQKSATTQRHPLTLAQTRLNRHGPDGGLHDWSCRALGQLQRRARTLGRARARLYS